MRILIFHGYLLRGTGSNIYNVSLARALARLGHQVDLVCQDREVEMPEGVTVHEPDIGRVLPVYVADTYEGFDAVPFSELDDAALNHYLEANVAAVRASRTRRRAGQPPRDGAGDPGPRPGRPGALRGEGPRSALEYTVRPGGPRFLPYALEGVRAAGGVLAGSSHTAHSLWEVLADEPALPEHTRLLPPGVDVHSFRPGRPPRRRRASAGWPASWRREATPPGEARRGRPGRCTSFSRDGTAS